MLSAVAPLRGLVILLGLTLAIAAWPPPARPPAWHLGYVEHGSLHAIPGGHVFRLIRSLGSDAAEQVIDVVYDGILPDTVCEGVEVVVEGLPGPGVFEASDLHGNHERHDLCWRSRCDRAAYASCAGTRYE